jgi:hypothetical protein
VTLSIWSWRGFLFGLSSRFDVLCRYVCDERWYNITRSIRLKGGLQLESLKQPTWCQLKPEIFSTVVQRASPKFPENVLFTYQKKAANEVSSDVVDDATFDGHLEELSAVDPKL